jgi:hypothetical protein
VHTRGQEGLSDGGATDRAFLGTGRVDAVHHFGSVPVGADVFVGRHWNSFSRDLAVALRLTRQPRSSRIPHFGQ